MSVSFHQMLLAYVQTFFIYAFVVYCVHKLTASIFKHKKPKEELEENRVKRAMIAYRPEALIPEEDNEGGQEKMVIEAGIDLIRKDYLSFSKDSTVRKVAQDTIRLYGVGTCGPRSFFGTTELHLELEKKLADFLGMEFSLIYPFGPLTASSVIGMYLARGDVAFVDEMTSESLIAALVSTKCTIYRFKHDCPAELYTILENLIDTEEYSSYESKYIILEGVYEANGALCDLPAVVLIAKTFKIRIILDETNTIGVFGATGRGLTEHFLVATSDVDLICGNLEPVFGTIGGFCTGTVLAVQNQFILSLSFVYSASLSGFLVRTIMESLDRLGQRPKRFQSLCKDFHSELLRLGFVVLSDVYAPFKVFEVEDCDGFLERCRKNFGVYLDKTKMGVCLRLYHDLCFESETKKIIFNALAFAKNATE